MKVKEKVLFAGFGGQGILAAGKIFAETCIDAGLNASWLPSYGPEMRGGTCNCQVVVSDERILSPIFTRPTGAIIMNQASMDKFAEKMDESEMVVVNKSLVGLDDQTRKLLKNVRLVEVDATNAALEIGSVQCANMVALGAYAKHSGALDLDLIRKSVEHKFSKKPAVLQMNLKALKRGYEMA